MFGKLKRRNRLVLVLLLLGVALIVAVLLANAFGVVNISIPNIVKMALNKLAIFDFTSSWRAVDETIIFHTLSREHLDRIVEIQLNDLAKRLKDRHLEVEFTDAAKKQIMDEGYDPAVGARPLKRVIQQRLENKLATKIIAGKIAEGDRLRIDGTGRQFEFEKI